MKYTPEIYQHIHARLSGPLPGVDAQMEMAPPGRDRDWEVPENARKSAVLVLVYPGENSDLHLVLMKRSEDGRTHGGQISFPGGRWEETDLDFTHTALREAEEEVGVPQTEVEVLGHLSSLYIPPSNFMVYPTVGFAHQRPKFVPDPIEVAQVIETKLSVFFDPSKRGSFPINHRTGVTFHTPGYQVQGHTVWGATAMILSEFTHLIHPILK